MTCLVTGLSMGATVLLGQKLGEGIAGAFLVRIPVSLFMSRLEPVSLFRVGLATPCSTIVQIALFLGCYALTALQDRKLEAQ